MIKCPHCGDESPEFDYAHVCSRGQYAVKLPKPLDDVGIKVMAAMAKFLAK